MLLCVLMFENVPESEITPSGKHIDIDFEKGYKNSHASKIAYEDFCFPTSSLLLDIINLMFSIYR